MTTFTTEDRIFAEKDGSFTINVESGTASSPPHIVNSGASVMDNEPVAWIGETLMGRQYINGSDGLLPIGTPLYTHPVNPKYDPETGEPLIDGYPLFSGLPHPVKELTDEEIIAVGNAVVNHIDSNEGWIEFARAILRKAQEK
jgi:hypothetical protein